jgi:hypothetical protein
VLLFVVVEMDKMQYMSQRVSQMEIGKRTGLADKQIRCGKYGPLGLMETLFKLAAIIVALVSISGFTTNDIAYSNLRVAQMWILGLLMVAHIVLFVQRLCDKELQAVVFGFFNIVGHIAMFVMLFRSIDPSAYLITFCFLFIMGDYIKFLFLFVVDDFSVLWLKKPLLFAMTLVFIALYFVINLLQLVLWYEFPDE